jgi:hypothetical protein
VTTQEVKFKYIGVRSRCGLKLGKEKRARFTLLFFQFQKSALKPKLMVEL